MTETATQTDSRESIDHVIAITASKTEGVKLKIVDTAAEQVDDVTAVLVAMRGAEALLDLARRKMKGIVLDTSASLQSLDAELLAKKSAIQKLDELKRDQQ